MDSKANNGNSKTSVALEADANVCVGIRGLRKSFQRGENIVLDGLNLTVNYGETVAIMGVSGSGKSTLLNVLAGLDYADKGMGEYSFAGRSVDGFNNPHRKPKLSTIGLWRRMGFVFQTPFMMENFDVSFNVRLPIYCQGRVIFGSKARKERINHLLEQTNLIEHRNKLASQLSGGQRQRVAIARAVFHKPDLILADEPTGSLDLQMSKEIAKLLKGCVSMGRNGGNADETLRAALIVVTHDPDLAITFDRVEVLRAKNAVAEQQKGLTHIPFPDGIDSAGELGKKGNEGKKADYLRRIKEALGFETREGEEPC
jgi:putative ABC transport system ATP-binding protein